MAAKQIDEEHAPDPDEDNLDDLDDVLDELQATSISKPVAAKPAASSTAPSASGPGRPAQATSQDDVPSEAEFAQQLQAGMDNLINELDSNPDMKKQFEDMMSQLIAAGAAPTDQDAADHIKAAAAAAPKAPPPAASATSDATGSQKAAGDDFSHTIRKTMERMQASDAAAATSSGAAGGELSEDELFAQMMKDLQGSGAEDGGEGFNKMLLNMMTQLTNKEILYEPMKELHDKYPAWMEKNREKLSKEDMDRYGTQQKLVTEIVARFEKEGYSDESEEDREYIVERMHKMQEAGSPPPDLVGDMTAAQDALGDLDAGCPTQ